MLDSIILLGNTENQKSRPHGHPFCLLGNSRVEENTVWLACLFSSCWWNLLDKDLGTNGTLLGLLPNS